MGSTVSTERGDFYVERSGSPGAPPVVFVAGLGDDHSSWQEVVAALAASHECITFDNRGIGRSVVTPGPYTIRQLAEDAHALLARLGLREVAAVGSSMGGAICQEWALHHPGDLRRLVLSNTWAERDAWFHNLMEHWVELSSRGESRNLLYELALFCFSPRYLDGHPRAVAEFLAAPVPDLRGFEASARACQGHDTLARLSSLSVPTLVISGTDDILTRPSLSEHLRDSIAGCRACALPTGHMTFWEEPEEWSARVRDFLAEDRTPC